MTIGNRIKELRQSKGLSRAQFWGKIEERATRGYDIETGRVRTPADVVRKISDAFCIDVQWLLAGHGQPNKESEQGDSHTSETAIPEITAPALTTLTGLTDVQTVQYVVQYVETWLLTVDRAWTPEQKAEAIAIACRLVAGWRKRGLDQGQIDRQLEELLRLI